MARPRVVTLEERRARLLRRSELATIAQLPNWEVFHAVIEEEIESVKRVILGKAMGPGISPEDQAYHRGRISGLRAARSIPDHALSEQLTESSPNQREVAAGE